MLLAAQILRSFLQRKQIATLQELKEALGTISTMTVFRKLIHRTLSIYCQDGLTSINTTATTIGQRKLRKFG